MICHSVPLSSEYRPQRRRPLLKWLWLSLGSRCLPAGLDFDWQDGWRHVACYDVGARAVITHVEALSAQVVRHVPSGRPLRSFARGERVLMEWVPSQPIHIDNATHAHPFGPRACP